MDCSDIIESFDSLWFFSNVASSSSRTEKSAHAVNEVAAVEEEASKFKNPIEEKKQNESPSDESNLVPKCPKCGEFGKEEVEEFAKPREEKKKKKSSSGSSRRKRRSKRSLRKILGELDHLHLGFDYGNYMDFWLFDDEEIIKTGKHKQVLGSGSEYNQHMNMKMPPLDDNMAMKKHLKSWAYAVASTVR